MPLDLAKKQKAPSGSLRSAAKGVALNAAAVGRAGPKAPTTTTAPTAAESPAGFEEDVMQEGGEGQGGVLGGEEGTR